MIVVFDLDDTLYDEIEFVKSGFTEIANYLGDSKYYDFMITLFKKEGSGKIFDKLITTFNLRTPIEKLMEIYRFHKPNISLNNQSIELLNYVKKFNTSLISDGHYIMQKNKFDALHLDNFIQYTIFTDFYHTKKPDLKPFKMVMNKFNNEKKFIYISDNPAKDFIAPQKLNWIGIRYKNPNGIYKELQTNTDYEIENLKDAINILAEIENTVKN